ncbi:MAG: hypothetical protein ACK6CU_14165 [Deltaproteobacteria bacterium]|jgi:hypothetical protein
MNVRIYVLMGALWVAGCSSPSMVVDDASGGMDAAPEQPLDTGGPAPDAATEDTAAPQDAGVDAPALGDAGPPDVGAAPCTAEGMFRRVDCACGGMQSERCSGGAWQIVVPCDRETVCMAGAFETMPYVNCGLQQRECPDGCGWTDWDVVVPSGECNPAMTDLCSGPPYPEANCHCLADCTCEAIPGCPYRVGYP